MSWNPYEITDAPGDVITGAVIDSATPAGGMVDVLPAVLPGDVIRSTTRPTNTARARRAARRARRTVHGGSAAVGTVVDAVVDALPEPSPQGYGRFIPPPPTYRPDVPPEGAAVPVWLVGQSIEDPMPVVGAGGGGKPPKGPKPPRPEPADPDGDLTPNQPASDSQDDDQAPDDRASKLNAAMRAGRSESEKNLRKWRRRAQRDAVSGERARRFRRWVALTAVSASAGYAVHLVQLVNHLPGPVAWGALAAGGGLDQWVRWRGGNRVTVSEVRGFIPLCLLIVTRVPFASALAAVFQLAPLFALHLFH